MLNIFIMHIWFGVFLCNISELRVSEDRVFYYVTLQSHKTWGHPAQTT